MNALVPVGKEREAPLVRLAAGGVAAIVRLDAFDRRSGVAWYVVQLGTVSGEVRGHVIGAFADGTTIELGRLSVAGGTISESRFAVPQRGPRFAHIYVDLRADDLMLRLEAPPIPALHRPRAFRVGAACLAAGTLVATGGVLALAVPREPVVAAPHYAPAGEVVRVAYAMRGLGRARFAAAGEAGGLLAAGPLTASRGEIAVLLPRKTRGRVQVRVDVDGPLGHAQRAVSLAVIPPVATVPFVQPPAHIGSFAVRREETEGVSSVLASYLAVADAGTLEVFDATNHTVARAAFSRGGTSRIALPAGLEHRTLTVRLDVRRGVSHARTAVTLPPSASVIPSAAVVADAPPPSDAAPASADDTPETDGTANGAISGGSPDDPFAIAGTAVAGRPMTIAIRRLLPGMRLRLTDDVGNAVAETVVPADATQVSLTPPSATGARIYYLTCSYGSGHTEEVVVRSVRVLPR